MQHGDCSCCPPEQISKGSLFERRYWLYAFFREHVFRDHTAEIIRSIFLPEGPAPGAKVLELGCGPGFYSCRLAKMYPQIQTIGVDRSTSLLEWARARASESHLENCSFCEGDACALHNIPCQIDAVIVSRLFLIVQDRESVLTEIFRVLKPGGKCFLAEPTTKFKTRLPLWAMRISAVLSGQRSHLQTEPSSCKVMPAQEFHTMVHSQPWAVVETVERNGYQYAICSKTALDDCCFTDTKKESWSAA